MKWARDGVEWGGPDQDWYNIYWWNTLPPHLRYFGYRQYYYDGPIGTFGWWWGNVSWQLPNLRYLLRRK